MEVLILSQKHKIMYRCLVPMVKVFLKAKFGYMEDNDYATRNYYDFG